MLEILYQTIVPAMQDEYIQGLIAYLHQHGFCTDMSHDHGAVCLRVRTPLQPPSGNEFLCQVFTRGELCAFVEGIKLGKLRP